MKETIKIQEKGITLVALVITIIILLILAGVTITAIAKNKLLDNVELAKEKTKNAEAEENETLLEYENAINKYVDGTRENATTGCNPKPLLTLELDKGKPTDKRNIGTYYASTNFNDEEKDIFSEYLKKEDDGTWKVLKSGYYCISGYGLAHSDGNLDSTEIEAAIKINGTELTIYRQRATNTYAATPVGNLTVYIEKDTIIDGIYRITLQNAFYNRCIINIMAMF